MDADWLRELIESAGYDVREYSGRGMYGRQCIGLVTDDPWLSVLADLVAHCEDVDDAASIIRKCRRDDMGRGTVLYWPSAEIESAA